MLKPRYCKTFEDYFKQIFLKTTERGKRGKGIRRRVQAESTIPGNWESFLRIDDNKTSGYQKTVISTKGRELVCIKPNKDTSKLLICNHEEAHIRMLLHAADLVND